LLPKYSVLQRIVEGGLVAVVRAESAEQAKKITDACLQGGVAAIELTFTVPGAAAVIREVAVACPSDEIIIGAGTVLDPETARIAILAGAQYVVSPHLNVDTVKLCNRYQVPCMPGAGTIREIIEAMEAGADIVKVFPGETLGPSFIKAVKGPLPQASLMPTGGVSLDNAADWIKAGCVALGVGGNLTAGAKRDDYASITAHAKEFMMKIREARGH
jgi:2-dehydro-3-deoxyphosphogluconate aldolase/(4S)-4-hydroxy-2-oxoglutarate aldolase